MKSKINIRLIGIAILAILSTVIAITFVYYQLFQNQVRKDLSVSAKLLRDTHYFESVNIDIDEIDLSTDISELRVTWVDSNGKVLYDNDVTFTALENHYDRPEIKNAFNNGVGESIRRSDTLNKDTFYYAVLLDNGTVLRVATNAKSLLSVFMSAAWIITIIILLIISICIILSHLLTKQLLKPIEVLVENLDNASYSSPYRELDPIVEKLKAQHVDILSAAKVRQDFSANVSHELKTPLTAILGYSELLESGMVPEDQKNHFYLEIKNNSNRLISLINDIIRLSELDRSDMSKFFEEVDLFDVVEELEDGLMINAKQSKIDLRFDIDHYKIHGNKEMLKELVENLVQNAIRYNNPQGEVEVKLNKNDGHIELIVSDNGIGIPSSDLSRIFERFYRVDKSRSKATGGTGLGLAIVKHIVEIHDANIEVDSEIHRGTTFKVIF